MRLFVAAAILLTACQGKSSSSAPAATRFLPADPDTAFRVDVSRVRGWAIYDKLAPVALSGVEMILSNAKAKCDLDVMATATTMIGAKKGPLMAGDVTLIASGVPRDKVTKCLDTIAASKSIMEIKRDGDLFHAVVQGRAIASGALLATGEVVIVARGGNGVDPANWKAEVTQGATAIPAWWTELEPYTNQPVAVRTRDDKRVVLATANYAADGLAVKAKIVTTSADLATRETAMVKSIGEFMKSVNAGEVKVTQQGNFVLAELLAKGAQIDPLIKAGGAALFTREGMTGSQPAPAEPDDGTVYQCAQLGDAVETYMKQALASMGGDKAEMEAFLTKNLAALRAAYVDSCTTGKWDNAAIGCHVKNPTNLPRFEKCRMQLLDEQRKPFDAAVGAVLSAR